MAMTLKETTKRDFKIKGASIVNGKVYDDGEEIDLIDLLTKAFDDNTLFDLSVSEKSEEELEIDDSPTSEDEE